MADVIQIRPQKVIRAGKMKICVWVWQILHKLFASPNVLFESLERKTIADVDWIYGKTIRMYYKNWDNDLRLDVIDFKEIIYFAEHNI